MKRTRGPKEYTARSAGCEIVCLAQEESTVARSWRCGFEAWIVEFAHGASSLCHCGDGTTRADIRCAVWPSACKAGKDSDRRTAHGLALARQWLRTYRAGVTSLATLGTFPSCAVRAWEEQRAASCCFAPVHELIKRRLTAGVVARFGLLFVACQRHRCFPVFYPSICKEG